MTAPTTPPRCRRCTNPMDQIDPFSFICIPCQVNEYWFEEETTEGLLQREWDRDTPGATG